MQLRIRDLREDRDLKQREVAEYIGCSQQTYSRYENGTVQPTPATLEKLSVFYGTSVDYLLGLTDDPRPYPRSQRSNK